MTYITNFVAEVEGNGVIIAQRRRTCRDEYLDSLPTE